MYIEKEKKEKLSQHMYCSLDLFLNIYFLIYLCDKSSTLATIEVDMTLATSCA